MEAANSSTRPKSDDGPLAWQIDALCAQADPDAFYPENTRKDSVEARLAKAVCGRCWSRGQCLEYALLNDEEGGIWGGLDEKERRDLARPAS